MPGPLRDLGWVNAGVQPRRRGRLAHANRTDTGLLVRHLAGDGYQGMQQVHTHDLVLNRPAMQRLAVLSGYPELLLRTVFSTRQHTNRGDGKPSRHWATLGRNNTTLVRPCSLCAARRGARTPALVRLDRNELPICARHRRTLVSYHDEQNRAECPAGRLTPAAEQSLHDTPEILAAVHRYRTLRRRRRDTVDDALTAAAQLTSGWKWPWRQSETDPIVNRWQERSHLLPGVPQYVIRYPETIAFTTLFARMPVLLHTPRGQPRDPSPMVFLTHAARCLDHPAPEQLLRRHHPLGRWADADHLPSWHWRNANEPDRTIYAALHAGEIPRLRTQKDQIH